MSKGTSQEAAERAAAKRAAQEAAEKAARKEAEQKGYIAQYNELKKFSEELSEIKGSFSDKKLETKLHLEFLVTMFSAGKDTKFKEIEENGETFIAETALSTGSGRVSKLPFEKSKSELDARRKDEEEKKTKLEKIIETTQPIIDKRRKSLSDPSDTISPPRRQTEYAAIRNKIDEVDIILKQEMASIIAYKLTSGSRKKVLEDKTQTTSSEPTSTIASTPQQPPKVDAKKTKRRFQSLRNALNKCSKAIGKITNLIRRTKSRTQSRG